jgi:hypothetical protein
MGKASQTEFSGLQRGAVLAVVTAMFAMLLTVFTPALPARADGCGGQGSFGCSDENNNGGGNGAGGGAGQGTLPGTGGGGSGGGGGGSNSNVRVDRVVPDPGTCPYRPEDGKSALGKDYYWAVIYKYGTKDSPPDPYYNWGNYTYTPGYGYLYSTEVLVGSQCLYPPRTYTTTQRCYISSTSSVWMKEPQSKLLATKTSTSGYSQGSTDYNACVNSNSRVKLGVAINEKGFYASQAYSLAQTATVEVAYTPNEVTGEIPPPKIIALSPVFQTAPKNATGSLHCSAGWQSPGVHHGDWTETPCSSQNSNNPSYLCSADPVLYNGRNFGMGTVVQSMRDGKDNELVWNQGVSGAGITVDSFKTTFKRSAQSAPWSKDLAANNNLIQLDVKNAAGAREAKALKPDGLTTRTFDGRVNTAYVMGFTATILTKQKNSLGNYVIDKNGQPVWVPQPTEISQVLGWTGTRTMTSVVIVETDASNGVMTATPTTITVPTSGLCSQTASLEFIRAIGDTVPN